MAIDVMAELPTAEARREVLAPIGQVRRAPRAFPDVRDPGSVEEIWEAFGARRWVQYMPHEGTVEVREIGWCS
ncbi:hypothetical protein [Streptomyces sp. NPDC056690]|uniref:hypothetical protein n=1 Tax=unclassified Streptomyces TaxID=2593676 RepID=UPI00362B2A64